MHTSLDTWHDLSHLELMFDQRSDDFESPEFKFHFHFFRSKHHKNKDLLKNTKIIFKNKQK